MNKLTNFVNSSESKSNTSERGLLSFLGSSQKPLSEFNQEEFMKMYILRSDYEQMKSEYEAKLTSKEVNHGSIVLKLEQQLKE